jgi:hypothetical protein
MTDTYSPPLVRLIGSVCARPLFEVLDDPEPHGHRWALYAARWPIPNEWHDLDDWGPDD